MQIILLHNRLNRPKSLTLTSRHLIIIALGLISIIILSAGLLSYLGIRYAAKNNLPLIQNMLTVTQIGGTATQDQFIKENLAVMAAKLGEMQGQIMRLDALGARVQGLAGIKPEEFNFKELPGRGGAIPTQNHTLTLSEFQVALDAMTHDIERRSDYMNVVETTLMTDKIKSKLLPTTQPVNISYNASGFGYRIDPFTGQSAFHEGIDFSAPVGTPIIAAAGGVVIAAEYHYQFGNMLEIDHGNDIITRYAHCSRLFAKVGDIVKRNQHIADIGSTGRSTGSHLHFEVHVRGVPQNPQKFLAAGANQAKVTALLKH